jgi:hypothetical protein
VPFTRDNVRNRSSRGGLGSSETGRHPSGFGPPGTRGLILKNLVNLPTLSSVSRGTGWPMSAITTAAWESLFYVFPTVKRDTRTPGYRALFRSGVPPGSEE